MTTVSRNAGIHHLSRGQCWRPSSISWTRQLSGTTRKKERQKQDVEPASCGGYFLPRAERGRCLQHGDFRENGVTLVSLFAAVGSSPHGVILWASRLSGKGRLVFAWQLGRA